MLPSHPLLVLPNSLFLSDLPKKMYLFLISPSMLVHLSFLILDLVPSIIPSVHKLADDLKDV